MLQRNNPGLPLARWLADAPIAEAVKILLADDDPLRASAVARALAADPSVSVVRLPPGAWLVDAVAAHAPDVVIVDMARPDRDALESVRQVGLSQPRPVVLFVDEDDPSVMEQAIAAGVSSYNISGLAPRDVKPILRAAMALFHRHQVMQDELRRSQAVLRERAMIDEAKRMLIRDRRLSEPEAYRLMQRRAMTQGRRLADIAAELLAQAAP